MSVGYTFLNDSAIRDIGDAVRRGESVVLLGARHAGKHLALKLLHKALLDTYAGPVLLLNDQNASEITSISDLARAIQNSIEEDSEILARHPEDVFASIDRVIDERGEPAILMVPELGDMPHHMARIFINGLRSKLSERRIVAVLEGDYGFPDLVHGPSSELSSVEYVFVQGVSEEMLEKDLRAYSNTIGGTSDELTSTAHHLWRVTGGNAQLAQAVLGAMVERSLRRQSKDFGSCDDIERMAETMASDKYQAVAALSFADQFIAREPESWRDLESLLQNGMAEVNYNAAFPTPIEFSGVAVRSGNRLVVASPMIGAFVRKRYNARRLGDLYARNGDWRDAFEKYRLLSAGARIRPIDSDDRLEVETVVTAVCASLHAEVVRGNQPLKDLFSRACQYILGFQEVTFWERGTIWEQEDPSSSPLPTDIIDNIVHKILPSEPTRNGPFSVPEPFDRFAIGAIVRHADASRFAAVVIGDLAAQHVLSRERRALATRILLHFIEAQSHAIEIERNRERLSIRSRHVEIITDIVDSLGKGVPEVRHVLASAARALRDLMYSRVCISLVDLKYERIRGIVDFSDDPSIDMARMTDWPLNSPLADLQPYVVTSGKPVVVADPHNEPLVNPAMLRSASVKPIAVVPMFGNDQRVIGTIHVERRDCSTPSLEELDDLLLFGRQLATVVEQSRRINMLQSALDKIPEPVALLDPTQRVLYANKPAGDLLELPIGWRSHQDGVAHGSTDLKAIGTYVQTALATGYRGFYRTRFGQPPGQHSVAVLCERIVDWSGEAVGALLHIADLTYFDNTIGALRRISEAANESDAGKQLVIACSTLGHSWARLYLLAESRTDRLVLRASTASGATSEGILPIELVKNSDVGIDAWASIESRSARLFCFNPDQEESQRLITKHGLEATVLSKPSQPEFLNKSPGDYWLDIPLVVRNIPLGKLTVGCDAEVLPEQVEMLKALAENAAAFMISFRQRSQDAELTLRTAADALSSTVLHNVATRLAALPIVLARYRQREVSIPELRELNEGLASVVDSALKTVGRAKEMTSGIKVRVSRFDLTDLIMQTLKARLEPGTFELSKSEVPYYLEGDPHLLESAITELIENARAAARDRATLRITVRIEALSDTSLRVHFMDNGPGIPAKLKDRIFEDFVSVTPAKVRGSGLGLGFVRRVINAHRGTIREVGVPGSGAAFVIDIPRIARPSADPPLT